MASVSVKDEVSEVAGVKLIATGGIERDRRTIGNLCSQVPAFDRQGVGGIELVGVKCTRESAQLGRTKLERLRPVAGEISHLIRYLASLEDFCMRFYMHLLHPNHVPRRQVEQVQGCTIRTGRGCKPNWTWV